MHQIDMFIGCTQSMYFYLLVATTEELHVQFQCPESLHVFQLMVFILPCPLYAECHDLKHFQRKQ